jgi:hypothetical protein
MGAAAVWAQESCSALLCGAAWHLQHKIMERHLAVFAGVPARLYSRVLLSCTLHLSHAALCAAAWARHLQVSMYHRNVARQQQQMAAWLQKRKQENMARRAAGEEPLPEEDPAMFKPIPEPPALDQYLITNQIASYCDLLGATAEKGVSKMYLVQGLQNAQKAAVKH